MNFVSYAQNFEDVMLWRALKHVKNGVYVDVGAQHPVVDSVSKAFYEHGWRGIHIEPVPAYAELLRKDRPDETVLQVALADAEGMLGLSVIPDTGLSTAVEEYAQRHQVERGYESQRIQVPVMTLKAATKSLEGKDVHWLKIDVEGLEEKVLKGWDSQILRPWVIVIEATVPVSSEADYTSWDPILTAADYQFVYFDGLNRFYIAKEHAELIEAFSCPPNVFDGIELSGLASSDLCRGLIASHQASEKELTARVDAANEYNTKLQAHIQWQQNQWDEANEYNTKLQAHIQWQQNEWDSAKQRIEELSKSTGQLESELKSEQAKSIRLAAELNATNKHNSQLQTHIQWLQNELDVANSKINELNQSSHYWWTVADRLNQEQQRIYASKFWRITLPLRKIMQITKWFLVLTARLMKWGIRPLKLMIKPQMKWCMRIILNNHSMRDYALTMLAKSPHLKQHLRLFALRSGLIPDRNGVSTTSYSFETGSGPQNTFMTASSSNMSEELVNNLAPEVARIYIDLKKAIKARKN